MEFLGSFTTDFAIAALNAYDLRHRVIAHNIANHDVEGYQALELSFESSLQTLVNRFRGGDDVSALRQAAQGMEPQLNRADIPDVKLDEQMSLLAQNTLQYEVVLTALQRRGALMKVAIGGGGG